MKQIHMSGTSNRHLSAFITVLIKKTQASRPLTQSNTHGSKVNQGHTTSVCVCVCDSQLL